MVCFRHIIVNTVDEKQQCCKIQWLLCIPRGLRFSSFQTKKYYIFVCVCVLALACVYPCLSSMQRVCAILWRHLWRLSPPHFSTLAHKRHDLQEKISEHKSCVLICLQLLSRTFLILRRILRDIVINVKTSSCKVPVILVGFWRNVNFLDGFLKKAQISNIIKNYQNCFMRTDRPTLRS
jgi:hypothetical protein